MSLENQIGDFCWWSLMTKDVTKANDFYQKLFDWKLEEIDIPGQGPSTIYTAKNGGFADITQLEPDFPGPSHWMSYIVVKNVDEACQLAEQLGGRVCVPAFEIPTIGRTAVLNDPVGSAFHVFTPANNQDECELKMIGTDPGEICWMELIVDDPSRVLPFYSEMFGWTFLEPMSNNGVEYFSFESHGQQVGGIMKRPAQSPPMPPVWINYFAVQSVDAGSENVKALGGTIVMPKLEIPEIGCCALIEDPTGAHSYLFESAGM